MPGQEFDLPSDECEQKMVMFERTLKKWKKQILSCDGCIEDFQLLLWAEIRGESAETLPSFSVGGDMLDAGSVPCVEC